MPVGVVKSKGDEHKWEKAKAIAHGYTSNKLDFSKKSKKSPRFWKIVMGVFKRMKGK